MKNRIGFITERMLLGFGVDLVIHNVADRLASRGYAVKVYARVADDTYLNQKYKLELIPIPALYFAPAYELGALRYLNYLNHEKTDIWFIESFPYFSLLALLNKPTVSVFYGNCSTIKFPLIKKLNFVYMDLTSRYFYFKFTKRVIAISNYLKEILPQTVREKTEVIYNGSDHYPCQLQSERVAQFRQSIGINKNDTLLLYVGRLNHPKQPYKGTAELVEMYKKIRAENREVRLMMVGYGDSRDRRWLQSQGIIVQIKAPVKIMPLIYSASDIYVTASRWEGFNLPLAEAQYFAKPVIAYDCTAHPEVVWDGESGFLVHTPPEFIDRTLTLAKDSELRYRMGQRARDNASKFRWEETVDKYDRLIKDIL
jgi:glycosyltransferase involved in cell wall biosynthesis